MLEFCGDNELFAAFNPLAKDRSAKRFSNVPRSVFPPSSCESSPESRSSDSIRPNRFSNPSIYLALKNHKHQHHPKQDSSAVSLDVPFWRIPLLLHLSEHTIGLVVDTMRALGHLAITLYLLFPTHIASLEQTHSCQPRPPSLDPDSRQSHNENPLPLRSSSFSHRSAHPPSPSLVHPESSDPGKRRVLASRLGDMCRKVGVAGS